MKRITDFFIKEHLKQAAGALAPDMEKAAQIWEQPVEKAAGDEWYLDGINPEKRHYKKAIKWISAVAACFCVCLLSFCMISLRVDATIYLDVNPGIVLQINRGERVLDAEALNKDGEIILEDMELKNTDLDVAVNAILGSMVRHGYVSEAKNTVLLSVEGGSTEKTKELRSRLSEKIYTCLSSMIGSGRVFDQDLEMDDALEALVKKYNITPGRAALLQRLTAADPTLDSAELAGLSVSELTAYLARSGIDLREFANYTGDDFDMEADADDTGTGDADSDSDAADVGEDADDADADAEEADDDEQADAHAAYPDADDDAVQTDDRAAYPDAGDDAGDNDAAYSNAGSGPYTDTEDAENEDTDNEDAEDAKSSDGEQAEEDEDEDS